MKVDLNKVHFFTNIVFWSCFVDIDCRNSWNTRPNLMIFAFKSIASTSAFQWIRNMTRRKDKKINHNPTAPQKLSIDNFSAISNYLTLIFRNRSQKRYLQILCFIISIKEALRSRFFSGNSRFSVPSPALPFFPQFGPFSRFLIARKPDFSAKNIPIFAQIDLQNFWFNDSAQAKIRFQ